MEYCSNCGAENLDETHLFCKKCGQPLKKSTSDETTSDETTATPLMANNTVDDEKLKATENEMPPTLLATSSKKKKWGIISVAIIAVLLLIGHFTMKTIVNPKKVIAAMDSDFQKENASAFLKNFTFDNNTKTDAKGFYTYIESQSWSDIRTQLLANAESLQNGDLIDPITDYDDNKIIKLVREPVLGGLYHKISFQLVPTHVEVSTDYSNIQLTAENDTTDLKAGNSTFIGEFLPGKYKWSAILKSEYGQIPFDGTMKIGDAMENNNETYDLEVKPAYTEIYSNNDDATLYINGKSTNKSIYDLEEIGPLPLDGSVTVQAKVKDGAQTYETQKVKVKSTEIALNFKYISDQQSLAERAEQLEELADDHYYSLESFYQDYRSAYESDVNNHIYNATENYVVTDTALDTEYKGYFDKFVDDDSINLHTNQFSEVVAVDENTFKFKTAEEYTFYSHKDITIDYKFKKTYTVILSGDSYLIDSVEKKKISQQEYD